MSAALLPALCVALHDVAPETWPECERLLDALAAVERFPVTLLVVPDYHRNGGRVPDWYARALDRRLERGDELALHGCTHLDDGPLPRTPADFVRRRLLTAGEGEFAALGAGAARVRMERGRAWFAARGWPLHGFVAPAWLLGPGAWTALDSQPFDYTTTRTAFHLFRPRVAVRAPCIVYSARSAWRRALSIARNRELAARLAQSPLARIALHPADAAWPAIVADVQRFVERLLDGRFPMTKRAFARQLAGVLAREPATSRPADPRHRIRTAR